MSTAAKMTPNTIPRYFTRFPTSIFQAIQSMAEVYPSHPAALVS